jgi:LuxR family transcriptional regulator, maltose regulon positive regulatory protein
MGGPVKEGVVRSADWSGAAGPPVAPAVRDGVVSRPGLFELLGRAGRVTEVTAPAGSGKTLLLRSWIGESGLAERAAWVPVQGEERDPQRFWLSCSARCGTRPSGRSWCGP